MATALKAPTRVAKATGKSAPKPKTVTAKPSMVTGPFGSKLPGGGAGGSKKSAKRG